MNKAGKDRGLGFKAIASPDPRGSGPGFPTLLAKSALPACEGRTGGMEAQRGRSFR